MCGQVAQHDNVGVQVDIRLESISVITLIHGPAELSRAEALDQIRQGISPDPTLAGLNTVSFDAKSTRLADLQFACDALPFLADRRLVVAEGLLRRASAGRGRAKAGAATAAAGSSSSDAGADDEGGGETAALSDLLAYLPNVPDTTELVFLEDDLITANTILKRLSELGRAGKAKIIVCARPKKADLPGWIRDRAKRHKLTLDATAVADLADFVGDDLRQLDQEMVKLADYAASLASKGGSHTVTRTDVRRLVPATRTANVFDLVEALGNGNAAAAARLMQHALDADGEQPLRLMALISRQYRLIIQAKELHAGGATQADLARQLGVPDWTVPKLVTQAARYSFDRLTAALESILGADEAIKTGKLTDREAMDVLLAQLAALMNA
jgi:DNA polymerase III subunit delta